MPSKFCLEDFSSLVAIPIRYADTDRQGHVNNAVFATFLEAGRLGILFDPARPVLESGRAFVIAHLSLDFLSEINWPGEVQVGTRISRIGRSSVTMEQGIFQHEICAASAESVVVLTDETTRRSHPLPAPLIDQFRNHLWTST